MKTLEKTLLEQIREELLQKLYQVSIEVEEPNCGGCGIIAYSAFKFLRSRMSEEMFNKHVRIIYLSRWGEFDVDEEEINDLNQDYFDATSCSHAVIEFDGVMYDSDGLFDPEEDGGYESIISIVSEEYMIRSISNEHDWNYMFVRETEVPKVENIFELKLNLN